MTGGGNEARRLGRWGEALVAQAMRKNGWHIVDSRYRCRYGEIDLIAEDSKFLCFIEVKLRKNGDFAPAAAFVDYHKQQRLRQTAMTYLQNYPTSKQPRFDVVEVYAPQGTATKNPKMNYLANAFW